jgi:NAD(P)-dependent dehydrogenase (short-subunit alcohol dehydrogenase family)
LTVAVVPADVADFEQVKAIADKAIQQYGRLDTWVHLAAINLYAIFEQTDNTRRV